MVAATRQGDLTQRIDADFADADIARIAQEFNALMDTLSQGPGDAGDVLAALAEADLSKRMEGDYEGEFARLKNSTNTVADKLAAIVTQLKKTSFDLKTATGEILSGANDLSERTTKQAATIEETSAAMEQLAATVNANAKRAAGASEQRRRSDGGGRRGRGGDARAPTPRWGGSPTARPRSATLSG